MATVNSIKPHCRKAKLHQLNWIDLPVLQFRRNMQKLLGNSRNKQAPECKCERKDKSWADFHQWIFQDLPDKEIGKSWERKGKDSEEFGVQWQWF